MVGMLELLLQQIQVIVLDPLPVEIIEARRDEGFLQSELVAESCLLFVSAIQDIADAHAISCQTINATDSVQLGWLIPGQVRGVTLTS
jgi:hypothetical protein